MTTKDFIEKYKPCREGVAFAERYENMAQAWDNCPRVDWLLWICDKIELKNDKQFRLFAVWCVRNTPLADGRTTWDLLTDPRSRLAVEVAEKFAHGKATREELKAACSAAGAARDAAWAAAGAGAARDAAWAAAWGADVASWADAREAAAAACAASDAAGYAAKAAARNAAKSAQAVQFRKMIDNSFNNNLIGFCAVGLTTLDVLHNNEASK